MSKKDYHYILYINLVDLPRDEVVESKNNLIKLID
jgi:hypothetical protein